MSRNTQGVRLIGLGKNEDLVSLARVCESEDDKDRRGENASEEESDSTHHQTKTMNYHQN